MKALLCSALLVSSAGFAAADKAKEAPKHDHNHPEVKMPKEFDAMKELAGTWEGTSKMGDKEVPVKVIYELTSGGTAIAAKLMPGTPHEMLSVYHKEGDSLGMTHYCAAGNQPHMKLTKNDGKTLVFKMDKDDSLMSSKGLHMHQMTLTKVDKDTIREEWVAVENGKEGAPHVFTFKRAK